MLVRSISVTTDSMVILELIAHNFRCRGLGLRHIARNIRFVEQDLALKIADFHEIAIDNAHMADPAPTSALARTVPRAPQPQIVTRLLEMRSCPALPIPGTLAGIVREDLDQGSW